MNKWAIKNIESRPEATKVIVPPLEPRDAQIQVLSATDVYLKFSPPEAICWQLKLLTNILSIHLSETNLILKSHKLKDVERIYFLKQHAHSWLYVNKFVIIELSEYVSEYGYMASFSDYSSKKCKAQT